MKNKKILLCSIILICIILIGIVFICIKNKPDNSNITNIEITPEQKVQKGNKVFGNARCKGHSDNLMAGQALTKWTCKICGYKGENSNTNTPAICSTCASITGRCSECGKLVR